MRTASRETPIAVVCVINQEYSDQTLFEERSIIELGRMIREGIGSALFDEAEYFRIQGTGLSMPTPWGAIRAFFGSAHIEEAKYSPGALHEVNIEALDPVQIRPEWLSRKSNELIEAFEEGFEAEFADTISPENGVIKEESRRNAIEVMSSTLQHISTLFTVHQVVASRHYGRDEVFIIMTNPLDL